MRGRAGVFLDKDGTLIDNVPDSADPSRMRLAVGAADGVRRLHAAGYTLAVVSNQPGVARGAFPESALAGVERRLRDMLAVLGVPLAGLYYCPHHPAGAVDRYRVRCQCRKPAPGLLERAADEHGADLCRSWMVGDILDDVEAGRRAGCRTVLVDSGGETEWLRGPLREPHHVAADLAGAAAFIIERDGGAAAIPTAGGDRAWIGRRHR